MIINSVKHIGPHPVARNTSGTLLSPQVRASTHYAAYKASAAEFDPVCEDVPTPVEVRVFCSPRTAPDRVCQLIFRSLVLGPPYLSNSRDNAVLDALLILTS